MKAYAALLCVLLATPALAGTWTAPEGCQVFLTVQAKGCRVSQHYRCEADPAGDQWRADFDQEGVYFLSHIDAEAQWVESFEQNPVVRQTLDALPSDPASFSNLMASGMDAFDFRLSKDDGNGSAVVGFDRLNGKTVVIDGITLQQTEFEATETDLAGNKRTSRGNEYVNEEWRLFFSGPSEWDAGDGTFVPVDGSPMEFIFPGEPGFLKTQPIYDCDAVMSEAAPVGGEVVRARY